MALLPSVGSDPYTYKGHTGVDFLRGASMLGKPFYASGPGVVLRLSKNAAGGNWIVIRYDAFPGHEVGYAHMRSHNGCPAVGTRVNLGTRLGYVGDLGTRVTGPHVHVQILDVNTSASVWTVFDRNRWVGQATPAGGVGNHDGWTDTERQQFLTSLGLDTGGIGNGWGPKSKAATVQFQKWVGLKADGVFGANTGAVGRIIQKGGNWTKRPVKEIQTFLAGKGYPVGAIDGQVGNKFNLSTYMFQRAAGLKADAQWGADTDAKAFPPAPTSEPIPGRNATSRPLTAIQAFLAVPPTGTWDRATSDAVAAFQQAQGITVDRIWGVTSDGLAFPPAGSLRGVDYSFARPDPKMLVSRGVKHVGRYLHDSGKGLTRPEYDSLRAAGLEVWLIFERDGKELLGGFAAGKEAATIAEAQRTSLGLGAQPIYFNVDFDAPAADMPAILDALDGAASVIGLDRVGLYAGIKPIAAAFDAGKITWGFQTYAWSGGKWDPRAQLQQWSNGQWGGTVDFTRAMVAEYGQHEVSQDPAPQMVTMPKVQLQAVVDHLSTAIDELQAAGSTLESWLP